jgi:hypothetical protein
MSDLINVVLLLSCKIVIVTIFIENIDLKKNFFYVLMWTVLTVTRFQIRSHN